MKPDKRERKSFNDLFSLKENGMTTRCRIEAEGYSCDKGTFIRKGDKIGGVDFNSMRFLDLSVVEIDGGYRLSGFLVPEDGSREVGTKL